MAQFGQALAAGLPRIRQSRYANQLVIEALPNSSYYRSQLDVRNGRPVIRVRAQDGMAEVERQLNLLESGQMGPGPLSRPGAIQPR